MFWILAVVMLFFMDAGEKNSLCFFHWLGINHCPGCGIGHSIHSALHFQFLTSFKEHPFGIIALIILFTRIKQLLFPQKKFTT